MSVNLAILRPADKRLTSLHIHLSRPCMGMRSAGALLSSTAARILDDVALDVCLYRLSVRRGSTPVWFRLVYTGAPGISERNHADAAQKIQTLFIDDLDGSAAEGTVRFGLDGTEYEIDLNEEHAGELRDALARYVGAARRAGGAARRPARTGRRAPAGGLNTTEVREWAKAQGIEVKDRGRVPAELVVGIQGGHRAVRPGSALHRGQLPGQATPQAAA